MAETDYYSKWYETNKGDLAKKRRERYATDPVYRKQMLDNRAKYMAKKKAQQMSSLPEQYTITFSEAAEKLGITLWRLRNWRSHGYFPEPYQHGKYLYFTESQFNLLGRLNEFIADKPRLSRTDTEKLDDLTNLIFSNW